MTMEHLHSLISFFNSAHRHKPEPSTPTSLPIVNNLQNRELKLTHITKKKLSPVSHKYKFRINYTLNYSLFFTLPLKTKNSYKSPH